eukprot:1033739-Pelagomonas_calceolata.AAC.1
MAEDLDVVNRDRAAARERRGRRTARRSRRQHGEAPHDSAFPPPPASQISDSQTHLVMDSGYPSMFQTPHQLDSGYPSLCASPPHNNLSGTYPCLTADDTVAAAAQAAAALPSRNVSSGGSAFAAAAAPGAEAGNVRDGSWGQMPDSSFTNPLADTCASTLPHSNVSSTLPSHQGFALNGGASQLGRVHAASISGAASPTFGDGTHASSCSPPSEPSP